MKDMSEKQVVLSGLLIPIPHASKRDGAILCFGAGQYKGLIRGQTFCLNLLSFKWVMRNLTILRKVVFRPILST
jgi:hypothetical protein